MSMNVKGGLTLALAVSFFASAVRAESELYSVSDGAEVATPATQLTTFGGGGGCDSCGKSGKSGKGGCDSCSSKSAAACEDDCGDGTWRLFPETAGGWSVTGWVALGATANADNPATRLNGPVTFNDRSHFQANQLYMSVGRDADSGGCGLDWGGRTDILFGTDFFFTQAVGLETDDNGGRKWNRQGNQYGLALPQIYGELAYNDFSVKLGHFYTIIGNEVVTAPDNFFYSHAYTMQYGEPFTHTGALGTWQYNDCWTLWGGLVNGWDKFDAQTDQIAFLGGFSYAPTDANYSLTATMIYGDEDGATGVTNHTRTMYSIVFNYDFNDKWSYLLQHDNGWNNYAGGVPDQEWYGINQYLFYTINDCWKLGMRGEWFRDDDGSRMSGIPLRNGPGGPVVPPAVAALGNAGFAGNYYNVSVGLNWTPTTNIIVRPELRMDWSDGTAVAPYDDFTKDSQMTAAFDAIWIF